jgi:hypothetical protein
MNSNYLNIERSEYDKLKRCEIALEILFNNTFREGLPTYISREDESAFMLVYGKEIDELKSERKDMIDEQTKNHLVEELKKLNTTAPSDYPTTLNEVTT